MTHTRIYKNQRGSSEVEMNQEEVLKQGQGSPKRRPPDHIVRMKMPNGAEYEGEVFEGRPQGRGKMRYQNGQRYQGDFFNGMKHGKGKYYYMKGELYIGDWFQNKKQGKGQYFYRNGTIYNGAFVDNKKHGSGRVEEPNGSYFDGQFTMNNKDKTGVYYDATKKIEYLLTYENGKIIKQEIKEDLKEMEEGSSSGEPSPVPQLHRNPTRDTDKNNDRQFISEDLFSSGVDSLDGNPAYNSNMNLEKGSLRFITSGNNLSLNKSKKVLDPEQYLDPSLLAVKVCQWGNSEVSSWLSQIGFGDCNEQFTDNNIQGDSLLVLNNEDLKELGVGALGDRRILLREIEFLKLVFKSQCMSEPIAQYIDRHLTLSLVKKIKEENESREESKKMAGANPNGAADGLSSSSSSVSEDQDRKKKEMRQKGMNMQSRVEQYLENKGIKLTFLIPKEQIEIIEPIGKGGYGQVFLGKWMGQQVAVKKYLKKQGFRNKHIGHFIEEVQVINKLNHPCIVLYMGMCIYDNEYAMVTEFLSGGSLFDYLHKKKQKLSEDLLVAFCKDVSLGMAYLHEKKVLHCDLKSSNLLIDDNDNIKLCDFGLSRITSAKNNKKNKALRVGTPHWMAPQILNGGKYDSPSDIYSFGILLWEMMTGKIPYKDYSTAQIIGLVGKQENHHIEIPDYPNKELLDIFMRCTERDPTKRPTFKQIVRELEKVEAMLEEKRGGSGNSSPVAVRGVKEQKALD